MTSPKISPILLLTLISFIEIYSCFHWDGTLPYFPISLQLSLLGNILYDLETNTQSDFTIETADWFVSNYQTPGVKFYNCANSFVMGGYNVLGGVDGSYPSPTMQYFQRTYSSLPYHNQIYLQMMFFQIDSWDFNNPAQLPHNDYFSIAIDGNVITGWQLNVFYSGTYPLCGNPGFDDFVFTIALAYPHSASSLTLTMMSYTNEDTMNESFGFRNIQIEFLANTSPYFSLCAPGAPSSYLSASRCQTSCTAPGNSIIPASYGFCFPPSCSSNCKRCSTTSEACTSCQTGWFLVGTICYPTCDYPLSTKLLGGVTYCETPCPGQYAWWDGACSSSCSYATTYSSYPIVGTTVSSFLECQYPCGTNEFLFWNASCLSTCPSPFLTTTYKNRKFCEYPCASSEHLYWNGSCLSTCPSPLSPETQGTSQQRKFCWYTCPETQYLYWNGSCLNNCPYPLEPEIQYGISSSRNFCWYPCQPSEYLYWNRSCIDNCPSPLSPEIQGTSQQRNFCWYQCQPSEYLYWNGSCLNTCPSPLSPETQSISQPRNFCWYSCQPSEYSYWNGSCINTCPSPLSPETQGIAQQRDFCWYTCQPSEYLYWNQSCSNHCPIPLISYNLSGNQFCFLPCDMPNIYWYQDFSCRSECNFPYNLVLHDSVSQCLKPCSRPSEYFYDLEKECHDTCDPPYVRQIINTIKVCHITRSTLLTETNKIKSTVDIIETLGKITSAMIKAASIPQLTTPRSPLLIQLSSLIQYIRYMRIDYPWRVQLLFQSNGPSLISLSFDFSIPNKIQNQFDNYPLPYVFERYNLDSNFINNMWDLMNTILLVILVICALILLRRIFRKKLKINHILKRILQSLKWNIPIAMISGGAGEIIFYASLQIRNTPLGSTISIISFLISLFMIFWIIVLLIICLKILRGFHLQRQKVTPTPSSENQNHWLQKWKGYEILYDEIEEKYLFSLAYMVIYVIRAILFLGIIANFYDYPLTQSILINVVNLLIFIYLLYYKPLKNIWNSIQLFVNEILGNILTICVLALAIMDKAEIEARNSRVTIGNVMIVIMLIFYVLGVVFLIIEGILFLIRAYKTWKELRARGIKNPLKIIQIVLFGEDKTVHKETTLELSQTSSRLNTSTIFPISNSPLKPDDQILFCGVQIQEKNSSMISDMPLNTSPISFLPVRELHPHTTPRTELDIPRTKIETFRGNLPNTLTAVSNIEFESPSKEMNVGENIPELILTEGDEPKLRPNVDYIRNWGNLKARIKRFNQSIHKAHWSNEE